MAQVATRIARELQIEFDTGTKLAASSGLACGESIGDLWDACSHNQAMLFQNLAPSCAPQSDKKRGCEGLPLGVAWKVRRGIR